jgi:hypothetical protein
LALQLGIVFLQNCEVGDRPGSPRLTVDKGGVVEAATGIKSSDLAGAIPWILEGHDRD